MDEVRKLIGVVPQFDILWDELTIREHMWMFCQIKGIGKRESEQMIEDRIRDVKLLENLDDPVMSLSGGMRRRLSVAIASIGNPKVIFMDEPTTGMDVVSKREVWELILKLKQERSFILTTHQMEEADILSDKIAIIVDGQLRSLGTSLFLKNHYGTGYRYQSN